jgi:hypothetical protein
MGTDTYERPADPGASGTGRPARAGAMDSLLAGVRRLAHLADSTGEPREIFRALAGEMFAELGVEEVHVHHLSEHEDTVVVYMFGGDGRFSYLAPPGERPHGVAWVAESGKHIVAHGTRELAAALPRLAAGGQVGAALLLPLAVRGEVEAVVILARADGLGALGTRGAIRAQDARRTRDAKRSDAGTGVFDERGPRLAPTR